MRASRVVFLTTSFALGACMRGPNSTATTTASTSIAPSAPHVTTQVTGATGTIFAVAAVNASVVWAAGTGGTVLRTRDGGTTWSVAPLLVVSALDFATYMQSVLTARGC